MAEPTDVREGLHKTLLDDISAHRAKREGLSKVELNRAHAWGRLDLVLSLATIFVAAAAAVTVWPDAIATWVPGVLAALTALVATTRSALDPAGRRATHVERGCSLDWSAERLGRLASDVVAGTITDAAAWTKHDELVEEGRRFETEAEV